MRAALAPLRRRIALAICPDLAELPYEPTLDPAWPKAKNAAAKQRGDEMRRLDRLYAAHTGVTLDLRTAPPYDGPMYQWPGTPALVREGVIGALVRLRRNPASGLLMNTHFQALNYFAAIWPATAPWPRHIPRPPKSKKEAV